MRRGRLNSGGFRSLERAFVATEILAFRMTEVEWNSYQKEHPNARKEDHEIVKDEATAETPKKEYKHKVRITKEKLKETLSKGHYTVISAGRNPSHEDEKKLDPSDPKFSKRHQSLQDDLEELGVPYTEVVGHYGGEERSFLIMHDEHEHKALKKSQKGFMVHYKKGEREKVRKRLDELGKKYNQDSVLHGENGNNFIQFTTGKNSGKTCGGKGWKEVPEASDYFTDVEVGEKEHSKVSINIDSCFKKGLL